jgi:hypothetical protein
MTPRDIIGLWRLRYGDAVEPFYWSDAELLGYVAEGQTVGASRMAFITDQSSEACFCPVFSGDPLLERHPAVLRIMVATMMSSRRRLMFTTTDKLDAQNPNWADVAATPELIIPRFDDAYARLYPIPVQDDSVHLTVRRLPIEEVVLDGELELRPHWHPFIERWVTHRALSRPGERYDGARAIEAKSLFEDIFGVETQDG